MNLAQLEARALGYPDLRLLVIPHPLGGLETLQVKDLARKIAPRIEEEFRRGPAGADEDYEFERFLSFEAKAGDEPSRLLYGEKLTDGLPVIAPTPDRVERMMKYWGIGPQELIGPIPPAWNMMTWESLAANAVMAGCVPEHFPVVVNAVKALLEPAFNLYAVQTTTHPAGAAILLSGPLAAELGICSGAGCLGPGFSANACIGRAVRLVLLNGGGAWPGEGDKATFGQPGKFSMCFAENEQASIWPAFRSEFGVGGEHTTLTVIPAESPHNINDHGSTTAEGILRTVAGTMATTGNNNLYWNGDTYLLLGPEHAATLARDGLGKDDVRRELHRRARVPASAMSQGQLGRLLTVYAGVKESDKDVSDYIDPEGKVAVTAKPEDIRIVIAGGAGKHSMWLPTFGLCSSVTRTVENFRGEPVRTLADFLPG